MRFLTPHTGPNAGTLCVVGVDGLVVPAPVVDSATSPPAVALPRDDGFRPASNGIETAGEPAPWVDTRGNRSRLVQSIVQHHGEAYRGWAEAKANAAVSGWTANVRSGSTPLPKR